MRALLSMRKTDINDGARRAGPADLLSKFFRRVQVMTNCFIENSFCLARHSVRTDKSY